MKGDGGWIVRSFGSPGLEAAWLLILPLHPPTPDDIVTVLIVRLQCRAYCVVVLPATVPVVAVSRRGSRLGSRGMEAGTCALQSTREL